MSVVSNDNKNSYLYGKWHKYIYIHIVFGQASHTVILYLRSLIFQLNSTWRTLHYKIFSLFANQNKEGIEKERNPNIFFSQSILEGQIIIPSQKTLVYFAAFLLLLFCRIISISPYVLKNSFVWIQDYKLNLNFLYLNFYKG